MNGTPAVAAAFLLACTAFAQSPVAPSLHGAWLREVMDLDLPAATAMYEHVAEGHGSGDLERWVAAARLAELYRVRAIASGPAVSEVPVPLRATFQALQDAPPIEPLLERARRAPAEGLPVLLAEGTKLPALRPAVPAVEDWLMDQIGPSARDRMRQWLQTRANRSRSTDLRGFTDRLYAFDIVRAELQGQTAQANALRALYFADWHAPEVTGEPGPHLARGKANLEIWLTDPALTNQQQTLLKELRDRLDKLAATEPAAALALLQRLPLYAERLLDKTGARTRTEPSRR